jgi:hypothetical protein
MIHTLQDLQWCRIPTDSSFPTCKHRSSDATHKGHLHAIIWSQQRPQGGQWWATSGGEKQKTGRGGHHSQLVIKVQPSPLPRQNTKSEAPSYPPLCLDVPRCPSYVRGTAQRRPNGLTSSSLTRAPCPPISLNHTQDSQPRSCQN